MALMAAARSFGLAAFFAAFLAAAAVAQAPTAPSFRSFLELPDRETLMFHDGLDSDELIGAEIVAPNGARLATVADLLVDAEGEVRHVAIDPGSALGAGSRHVVVPIERLRRTEATGVVLVLDASPEELRALPPYRQVDDRWEPLG